MTTNTMAGLPWRMSPRLDDNGIEDCDGWPKLSGSTFVDGRIDIDPHEAAFIVRAVNHHEALVEALRSVLGHLDAHMEIEGHSIDDLEAADRARALLAQLDADNA